jgi:hypothetical protein
MKKKTFNKLIQGPLRFHHQDIHEEMDKLMSEIREIKSLLYKLTISNCDEKSKDTTSVSRGEESGNEIPTPEIPERY